MALAFLADKVNARANAHRDGLCPVRSSVESICCSCCLPCVERLCCILLSSCSQVVCIQTMKCVRAHGGHFLLLLDNLHALGQPAPHLFLHFLCISLLALCGEGGSVLFFWGQLDSYVLFAFCLGSNQGYSLGCHIFFFVFLIVLCFNVWQLGHVSVRSWDADSGICVSWDASMISDFSHYSCMPKKLPHTHKNGNMFETNRCKIKAANRWHSRICTNEPESFEPFVAFLALRSEFITGFPA